MRISCIFTCFANSRRDISPLEIASLMIKDELRKEQELRSYPIPRGFFDLSLNVKNKSVSDCMTSALEAGISKTNTAGQPH